MAEALTAPVSVESEASISERRASRGIDGGFYVDIEAEHPIEDSVTLGFHRRGWRGVNVISDPERFRLFAEFRAEDINVNAVVEGVSERGGTGQRQDGRPSIPRLSLSEVLDRYGPSDGRISFLKISGGAHTAAILMGSDWNRHRPEVIVLDDEYDDERCDGGPHLSGSGYRLAFFDGRRRIFCRVGENRVLPSPAPPHSEPSNGGTTGRRPTGSRGVDARLDALGHDAEEARAELRAAASELVEARRAAARAESSLARMREELEAVRAVADAAEARISVLSVELTRALEVAALAQRREEAVEAELATQQGLLHLASSTPGLPSEDVEAILAAHHSEALHHRTAHEELALWRESVRVSTSWRLTRPMRVVGRYLKRVYRVRRR